MTSTQDDAQLRRFVRQAVGLTWPIYYQLPFTRGLWPMGEGTDRGGRGSHLTPAGTTAGGEDIYLTYTDFTTGYFYYPDAALYDITGEITIGGMYYFDDTTPAITEALIGKWADSANNRSYLLTRNTAGNIVANVSSNGSATTTQASTETVADGVWAFCAMRYIPSSELSVFVGQAGGTDGFLNEDVNTTSIPASIYSGSARLAIGALDTTVSASNYLDGRAGMQFLCKAAVADDTLNLLFSQMRSLANL